MCQVRIASCEKIHENEKDCMKNTSHVLLFAK